MAPVLGALAPLAFFAGPRIGYRIARGHRAHRIARVIGPGLSPAAGSSPGAAPPRPARGYCAPPRRSSVQLQPLKGLLADARKRRRPPGHRSPRGLAARGPFRGRLQAPPVSLHHTIGLVIVGVLLALAQDHLGVLEPIRLTTDTILYLFLPTLLFPAAVQLDPQLLRRNLYPIVLLALPGMLLSTLIVAALVGALTPLSWRTAMLFGALISATDPVAVVALFKDLKAPERLSVLVEGESLFNDATTIVLFTVLLTLMNSDARRPMILVQGTASFVSVALGGLGVGALMALLYAALVRVAEDDPLVEIALSTVLAYTAFVVAQHYLNVSGIMAVVAAGLVGRRLRRTHFEKQPSRRGRISSTTGDTPNSSPTASSFSSWDLAATRF